MKATRVLFIAHLLAAAAALAVGYNRSQAASYDLGFLASPFMLAGFVLLGGAWFAAHRTHPGRFSSPFLFVFMLFAGLGVLIDAPTGWMLVVSAAALGAWDLDHFYKRLHAAGHIEHEGYLWRVHARRLAVIEGVGLLAGFMSLVIPVRIPFWWEVLLALIAVIGIFRVIESLRKEVE